MQVEYAEGPSMSLLKMFIAYAILMLLDYLISKSISRHMTLGEVLSGAFATLAVWNSIRIRDRNRGPK